MDEAKIEKDGVISTESSTESTEEDELMQQFARLNRVRVKNLKSNIRDSGIYYLNKYKKKDIIDYLKNPERYEDELRNAAIYLYSASPHFRRLIQYFAGLSSGAYIIEPYKVDPSKVSEARMSSNYRKVTNFLESMNLDTLLPKVLKICLREDTFYGTIWVTKDNVTIQRLPSKYCTISYIEGNVFNVSFDFKYFDLFRDQLDYYPPEFSEKYKLYREDPNYQNTNGWLELSSPNSFAIKCNSDIPGYSIPPFAGIFREIYDIEDYKRLKLSKTALENYAMIYMTLPMDDDGHWGIDLKKAKGFWENLDDVLPPEIGSMLTPMPLNKISFDRDYSKDADTIAQAEQNLFTAAGVSSLLFNNEKASSNALLLSIKADQSITYSIVKSFEDALNRYIQDQSYGKYFKVNFLDVSPYNKKEAGDAYLKAASYGLPTISMYAASQGLPQADLDGMSYLETRIMKLQSIFSPLISSSQLSSEELEGNGATEEGGAPPKDLGELTDSGEQTLEQKDDWN